MPEEDQLRAQCYWLLARLLACAPDRDFLAQVGRLKGDETDLGRAINALVAAARGASTSALEEEYFNLFIGVGHGELVPYASYYLTGFLHEKPLANLRLDMTRLGIARAEGVTQPEDNISSLCEMMAGMIMGDFGAPVDLSAQHSFFERHIGSWAPRFFEDLEAARNAAFYMPVGTIGRLFMAVENEAFKMAA
ncbi:MAG: molecular chaperone TorD family protein [Kiloniellales bacterium]|nr:molecular chaperone TorD family protein [Kiloniellales bacterium]